MLETVLGPQLQPVRTVARPNSVDRRYDGLDRRMDALEKRIDGVEQRVEERLNAFRTEVRAEFAAVHSEIRRLDQVADMRERLASAEAKLAARLRRDVSPIHRA